MDEEAARLMKQWNEQRHDAAAAERSLKTAMGSHAHDLDSLRQLRGHHTRTCKELGKFECLTQACVRALDTLIKNKSHPNGAHSQSAAIDALPSDLPVWPTLRYVPLCGAFPALEDDEIVPGHEVAALVDGEWILSTIVGVKSARFYLEDVLHPGGSRHVLPRQGFIPLPRWRPRVDFRRAHFEVGDEVLAMYPRTTCFYRAVVNRPPTTEVPTYSLQFEDDDFGDGRVRFHEIPVKYVLNLPQ